MNRFLQIYEFSGPTRGDYAKMDANLQTRCHWLWQHDLGQDVEVAMEYLRSEGVVH